MKRRDICVVTGTRAEYGLLRWIMNEIASDPILNLEVVATGMHLSHEYGLTYKEIERDGFTISAKVDIELTSDTPVGLAKSMGIGIAGFGKVFKRLNPDIIVILGDRYEVLAAAIAATFACIPIAHIHGGEATEGSIDEPIRNSLTKMSHIHFTATDEYRKRVIQMGEDPNRVWNFGAPGLDNLYKINLLSRKNFQESIGFELADRNAILTHHSVTLENNTSEKQIENILRALSKFEFKLIMTGTNSDTYGKIINRRLKEFAKNNPDRACFFTSLGQQRYLSALSHVDLMIGNSSSGIHEGPSFGIPVVNIGDRQKGRHKAPNIINCGYSQRAIVAAIRKAFSPSFRRNAQKVSNPYDKFCDGKSSWRIVKTLKNIELGEKLLKKTFFNINKGG